MVGVRELDQEGTERSSHVPKGEGYEEMAEQSEGRSGFGVWDLLPLARQSASLAAHREISMPASPAAAQLMCDLVQRLARRLSISREGGRSRLRVEIGEGSLSGAVLTVEGGVRGLLVELELPHHHDRDRWSHAIMTRLTERGLCVEGVRVS